MPDTLLRCSFCGKNQKQVQKLIAGPGVYICDECLVLCNEIVAEEAKQTLPLSEGQSSPSAAATGVPHLVGVAEIADLLDVSRQRIAQLVAAYEDFPKPEAELASGRVWSRAAIDTWIAAHPERRPGRAVKPEVELAERFSKDLAESLAAASAVARSWGHKSVGTEHLLLGLQTPPANVAARALVEIVKGFTDRVEGKVQELAPKKDEAVEGEPEMSALARRVLEVAALTAFSLSATEVGPEHVLLAIVQDAQSTAARALTGLGVELGTLRDRVLALREGSKPADAGAVTNIVGQLTYLLQSLQTELQRINPETPNA